MNTSQGQPVQPAAETGAASAGGTDGYSVQVYPFFYKATHDILFGVQMIMTSSTWVYVPRRGLTT